MKNILTNIGTYLFVPAMFLGDYLTHHGAFIFLYDASLIIVSLLLIVAMFVLRYMEANDVVNAMKPFEEVTTARWIASGLYLCLALSYLLYFSHFFSAALLIFYMLVFSALRLVVKTLNENIRSA